MTRPDTLRTGGIARRRACALALAAALGALPASATDDAPKRKSGLWEVVLSSAQIPGGSMKMQTCVDRGSDDLTVLDEAMGECGEPSIRRDGARWIIEATCKVEGGTVKSRSVVSGDFERGFRSETEARYEPPIAGTSTISSVIEGRWVGACKPGQKHGDVEMPEVEKLMRDAGAAQ